MDTERDVRVRLVEAAAAWGGGGRLNPAQVLTIAAIWEMWVTGDPTVEASVQRLAMETVPNGWEGASKGKPR